MKTMKRVARMNHGVVPEGIRLKADQTVEADKKKSIIDVFRTKKLAISSCIQARILYQIST